MTTPETAKIDRAPHATAAAAADQRAETIIRDRFDELMRVWPGMASYLGIHAYDSVLPDMSRAAIEGQIAGQPALPD